MQKKGCEIRTSWVENEIREEVRIVSESGLSGMHYDLSYSFEMMHA